MRMRWLAGPCAALLLVTACSGVPRSSRPEVVQSVGGATEAAPGADDSGPQPGQPPVTVVREFQREAVRSVSSARQYLTVDAQRKWQPSPVTIVQNFSRSDPSEQGDVGSVVVKAPNRVGQIDATGVFTPTLKSATSADSQTVTYGLKRVQGQWRIDNPPPGVLINAATFVAAFPRASPLYFFDSTEHRLVADPRYSALQGSDLLTWLLDQLLAGPRTELQTSVTSELPDEPDPQRVTLRLGTPIRIELPGISQSDPAGRQKLAAQLAYTFGNYLSFGEQLQLTDGGRPVAISASIGDTFTDSDFPNLDPDSPLPQGGEFHVRDGRLINGSTESPVAGLLGQSRGLSSVAVRGSNDAALEVVAVAGTELLLGQSLTGYLSVPLPAGAGTLSAPDWQPGTDQAWIGMGAQAGIFLVEDKAVTPVSVTPIPRGPSPVGVISALRFSPDGARLAAVIANTLWIGSVVHSGQTVRIDAFEPITPSGDTVLDADWRDATSLVMTTAATASATAQISSVSVDGSALPPILTTNLPAPPRDVAADSGRVIVSVPGNSPDAPVSLWQRTPANDWQLLAGDNVNGSTGSAPVFSRPVTDR